MKRNLYKKFFATLFFLISSVLLNAKTEGTGLEMSASVDFLATVNDPKQETFAIREAEVSLFAPIDHRFHGLLSIAAHREDGVSMFELHEAFIRGDKFFSGFSAKAGQFFLGVGRLNQVHRHDWPFISPPTVFKKYFGNEGILDTGLEVSYLLPLPFYLDITAGVTSGWTFGHSHDQGKQPKIPTHYGRLKTFIDGGDAFGLALGLNYIGRHSSEGERLHIFGLDGVAKGEIFGRNYLFQTETWMRQTIPKSGEKNLSLGFYLFPQMELVKSFKLGVLFDYYTILSLENVLGNKVSNSDYAFSPTLAYDASEFASFKLAYKYLRSNQPGKVSEETHSAEFQIVFILGAHPAHDF